MENAKRILYSDGAFMPKSSAMEAAEASYRFLHCYASLARWSKEQKKEQKKLLLNWYPSSILSTKFWRICDLLLEIEG